MTAASLGTVAVVGYGNQGAAHAQNLRESGVPVVVGAREGGVGAKRARADGFDVNPPAVAAARADIVSVLVPDEVLATVVETELSPNLSPGRTLVVAHGSALAFGVLVPDPDIDVVLVAPTGPGVELRERFVDGSGIPAVWAVHQDATGRAESTALAYAAGIGCARVGLLRTTVREEAVVDLFGEQAVLCGSLAALVTHGFRTLVERGYSPELAYLECVHQLRLTSGLISSFGIDGMWERISRTARYGGLEQGREIVGTGSREAMDAALDRIESGEFFRAFLADSAAGGERLEALRAAARDDALEAAGKTVREFGAESASRSDADGDKK